MKKRKRIYERSDDYRKNFLKYNKGVFGSGNYHCSYCGKILSPQKMRVDHLIPIHRVKKFGFARILMWFEGIRNINDVKNLVPACERCNSKKSSNMGLWLIKGEWGRHIWNWIILRSFLLAVFVIICYENRNYIEWFINNLIQSLM